MKIDIMQRGMDSMAVAEHGDRSLEAAIDQSLVSFLVSYRRAGVDWASTS